jgi:hypothetical protein
MTNQTDTKLKDLGWDASNLAFLEEIMGDLEEAFC